MVRKTRVGGVPGVLWASAEFFFLVMLPENVAVLGERMGGDCHAYLIFHSGDKMSLFPPVHRGWVGTSAPKVVTFGG